MNALGIFLPLALSAPLMIVIAILWPYISRLIHREYHVQVGNEVIVVVACCKREARILAMRHPSVTVSKKSKTATKRAWLSRFMGFDSGSGALGRCEGPNNSPSCTRSVSNFAAMSIPTFGKPNFCNPKELPKL